MSIVALFDMSGYSVRDWAIAGETCYCLDIVNDGRVGGYLSEAEALHPDWPQYIAPRDGYLKRTCIWGGDILWPTKSVVPFEEAERGFNAQTQKLGGKSEKTKQIRSMTPRGFARAFFEANYTAVTGKELPQ